MTMNKVFYLALLLALATACNTSSDKGAIAEAAQGIEKGEAGTFKFGAADGVEITADYYPNAEASKLIILLHQAQFSRGEYTAIAPRLVDSGFACLAVDLRSGGLANEIFNETAKSARAMNLPTEYLDAKQDIEAAIAYAASNTDKEIILWGSSYSASLALMVATENAKVSKVIVFSPGEYLANQNSVKTAIAGLEKPVFVTGSEAEYDMVVKPLVNSMTKANVQEFKPKGLSDHGSKTLRLAGENTNKLYKEICSFIRG